MKGTDKTVTASAPQEKQRQFEKALAVFLEEWRNGNPTLKVKTSGSTGTPKILEVNKENMKASARMTCSFLGLHAGDSALLCMPLEYIAGKMVVVRAEECGLEIRPVAPCGHPFAFLEEAPAFAALVPMQVYNTLQIPRERALLEQVRQLIIGGGAVDDEMERILKNFPHAVWSTYGMTETLSHIALRRLNGPEASDWYTPLPGIQVSRSVGGTLVIHAPAICKNILETNDVVELLPDNRFRIKGRRDNIINSGGIKIQIEEVENTLKKHLPFKFQITAAPDARFGEILVMLYENGRSDKDNRHPDGFQEGNNALEEICRRFLPPYHIPKKYIRVNALPLTETGKPDRAAARKMASTI